MVSTTNPSKEDIMFYHGLLDIAAGNLEPQHDELIPSFVIDDSLNYFSAKDEFEKCAVIKNFFANKYSFVIKVSRADW